MRITITPDNLPKSCKYPLTSTDEVVDVLAVLSDCYEWNDVENLEYLDSNIDYALEHLDWENIFIDHLNENPKHAALPKDHTCDLLAGACLALHFPEQYAELLGEFEQAQREAATDCLGDYSNNVPAIEKELNEAYITAEKWAYEEYLHGDQSNMGVLGYIRKAFAASDVDYDQKTDTLTLTWDDGDEIMERLGLDMDKKWSAKEIEKQFFADLENMAIATIVKRKVERKAENEKRKAENERLAAYKAEQAAEKAKEREAKLLSMKK